jgi:hypothetical protein
MPTYTAVDMQPCLRYRCWLACSGRVASNKVPDDIYGAAYNRESGHHYEQWLANAYRNYHRDPNAKLPYHGTPDPAFDTWLAQIYPEPQQHLSLLEEATAALTGPLCSDLTIDWSDEARRVIEVVVRRLHRAHFTTAANWLASEINQ